MGRVTYNWKERYLAEMNISYTGSEKFARGQRFGLFPSYSLGWRASEEPFIKKHVGDVLTNLNLDIHTEKSVVMQLLHVGITSNYLIL